MIYREYRPAPPLADLVECYWSLEGAVPGGASRAHRVLPDGCMDLVFHLGPGSEGPSSHAVGAMSRAAVVRQAGEIRTWGVRFRPGGAAPFLDLPADELVDRTPDLEAIWAGGASEVGERLADSARPAHRVETIDRALLRRIRPERRDLLIERTRTALRTSNGNAEITPLASRFGLGTRQLQRRFHAAVGLPPKLLARILRFRAAVDALTADPGLQKGPLALRLGYYDQAHFGRDFRELAGVSPTAYLEERRDVGFVQADERASGQIRSEEVGNP